MNLKIKKERIHNLIVKLLENASLDDKAQEDLLFEIKKLSPDPAVSDYIFWEDNLTIDEIVDKAFSYKPIILGDQSKKD